MRDAGKLSLLLSSMIVLSLACGKSSTSTGAGGLAAVGSPNASSTSAIFCALPGETPLTEQVNFNTLTLPTGQCGCPSNAANSGATCGAGNYCSIEGCKADPTGQTSVSVSLPFAGVPCPVPGETNIANNDNQCGCNVTTGPNAGNILACNSATEYCKASGCVTGKAPLPFSTQFRHVFVSSVSFMPGTPYNKSTSPNTFNSVSDADQACLDLGTAVVPGTHWRAWIQQTGGNGAPTAQNRIVPAFILGKDNRYIVLMDEQTVVSGPVTSSNGSGFDGVHTALINLDEHLNGVGNIVWTGNDGGSGDYAGSCNGWTSNSGSVYGGSGTVNSLTGWYSEYARSCNGSFPIYCIESDS